MRTPRQHRWCLLLPLVLALGLSGCQMDLYTKVKETDANDMLGALRAAGLDAHKKTSDGGKTWTLSVEESQLVAAMEVLRNEALPRERRSSLGDLFKKEGLISSPTEERVRFTFGIEQELAETVSKIDGVMVSRVHIVIPNNDPLARTTKPSSASVFVKHRRGADLATLVPAIKNLVVHAIEGLGYDQVTVTLVPGGRAAEQPDQRAAGLAAAPTDSGSGSGLGLWTASAGAVVLTLLLCLAGWAWQRGRSPLLPVVSGFGRRPAGPTERAADTFDAGAR